MIKSNLNRSYLSLLGTLFLLGCQAQKEFCRDPEEFDYCERGEITTKNEYYGADFPKSFEGLDGNTLRRVVNSAIKKNHVKLSYNPCTWVALQDIDESSNDEKSITAFYSRENIEKSKCYQGGNNPDTWNKEHLYPKGRWGGSESVFAFTDLHHLVASDESVNGDRDNNDFKEDEGNTLVTDSRRGNTIKCDKCKETERKYWEPAKNQKGQLARMMFYMDLRYEDDDFDLKLDSVDYKDGEFATDPKVKGSMVLGDLGTLLKWHYEDEVVSPEERNRNDKVQKWQGNRNPFIDYPELVEKIYGKQTVVDPPAPKKVEIVSALVNPSGRSDSGKETVTIKNFGTTPVNLKGWTIAGNNKRTSTVATDDLILGPGEEYDIVGLGQNGGAQLTNRANSKIILYDSAKNIVNEVKYPSKPSSGENIRFSSDEL